jgi:hypothetical protein
LTQKSKSFESIDNEDEIEAAFETLVQEFENQNMKSMGNTSSIVDLSTVDPSSRKLTFPTPPQKKSRTQSGTVKLASAISEYGKIIEKIGLSDSSTKGELVNKFKAYLP